jgi:hypothetical protein
MGLYTTYRYRYAQQQPTTEKEKRTALYRPERS